MSRPLEFRVAELERRLDNFIRIATIIDVDYEAALVKVRDGDFVSEGLPWLTQRANGQESSWDAPEVGERVLVLTPSGEPAAAVVLPAIYCAEHPAFQTSAEVKERRHKDEAVFSYNRDTHTNSIILPETGTHKITIGEAVFKITKDTLSITNGAMTIEGDSLDVTAPTINFNSDTITLSAGALNLGGTGGKKVARVGDAIDTTTKKIIGGSDVTKST